MDELKPCPASDAPDDLVEEVAKALCEASGDRWRSNKGLSEQALAMLDPDQLNNHWRDKARAIIPIVQAARDAQTVAWLRGHSHGAPLSIAAQLATAIEQGALDQVT